MPDKKDQQNEEEQKEEKFTGSPEQQLPDLEAEDLQERQSKRENSADRHKEQ